MREFMEEVKEKIRAGKRRCPHCKKKTKFEKAVVVRPKMEVREGQLGARVVFIPEVIPFFEVEYCTKCGNGNLGSRFFERQMKKFLEDIKQAKARMELLGGLSGMMEGQERPDESGENPDRQTPGGLIIP